LVAIAFTTLGNTEFHRRVTFAGRTSRARKRHLQDLLSFTFYAGYGSIVLLSLDDLVSHPSALLEATILLAASGIGGIGRFVLLRWWVFTER
jgi:putative flippase GtrA